MTAITDTAETAPAARTASADQLLRDLAFVLRMTRRVKGELLADRPEAAKKAARKAPELAAGLGV